MSIQLSLKELSKKWPFFKLNSINLDVAEGEYNVLLGPTGSGKTLLLEIIMGFQRPDSGKVLLKGVDVTERPIEKRDIGYVPQNSTLFPHLTVQENIEFGPKMKRVQNLQMNEIVSKAIELLKLNKYRNRNPLTLSGGEKQKVAIARAIVTNPKILLLDEPLSNIDEESRHDLGNELKRVNKEMRLTTIHVTHDKEEAYTLADKIAIMRNGELVQIGAPSEIYNNPKDWNIARFLGYENIYDVTLSSVPNQIIINGISLKTNEEIEKKHHAGIRAKDIILNIDLIINENNTFKGKIIDKTYLGNVTAATIDIGFKLTAILPNQNQKNIKIERGDEIYVTIPPTSIKLFSV